MSEKLSQGKYTTMEEFGRDAELVFANCRQFNPPATYPVQCADVVERTYKREWAKATEKKLTWLEKRSLQGLMTNIVKEHMYVVGSLSSLLLTNTCHAARGFSENLLIPSHLLSPRTSMSSLARTPGT